MQIFNDEQTPELNSSERQALTLKLVDRLSEIQSELERAGRNCEVDAWQDKAPEGVPQAAQREITLSAVLPSCQLNKRLRDGFSRVEAGEPLEAVFPEENQLQRQCREWRRHSDEPMPSDAGFVAWYREQNQVEVEVSRRYIVAAYDTTRNHYVDLEKFVFTLPLPVEED